MPWGGGIGPRVDGTRRPRGRAVAVAVAAKERVVANASGVEGREREIVELFTAAFTAAEGAAEGALIGALARDLLGRTAADELSVFTAEAAGVVAGAVVFSRLRFARDERRVFLLAPLAVAPARQGERIGRRLVARALTALRRAGVDIVLTYGDPAFYAKVGFAPISATFAPPPLALSRPEGWLARPLTDRATTPLRGPARCVEALNDPVFW